MNATAAMEGNFLRSIRMDMRVALANTDGATMCLAIPRPFDADDISRAVRNLLGTQRKMVRVLPLAASRMAKPKHAAGSNVRWDFRTICDCQVHARRERTLWRRSMRAARAAAQHVGRRGIAVIVGVPLAFGALGFPIEAMNVNKLTIPSMLRAASVEQRTPTRALPIFTTAKLREQFLSPRNDARVFTIDVAKEEFFRAHIPYGTVIYREARRRNLPPELVAAVVEAESDFRPRLVSGKDARGLMQIVPETGRLMGTEDLFNPEKNVEAGTKYLRYLFDRFGDQRMALAAYNAGEGNVERFGGIPPFPETLNYVQRVARRSNEYRQKVNGTYVASIRLRAAQLE
jgi:hypothetical protein